MAERIYTTRPEGAAQPWLQRKSTLRIGAPDDAYEREADRVADAVVSGRNLSRNGLSLSRIHVTQVQREDKPLSEKKPGTEEEKYKEAAKKIGEAFLETEVGKQLKEEVERDPLVKGAKEAGESFIGTLPGKIITGAAAAGAVATLAATHKGLPVQIPEIPLDKITPGLKVKITYEGPVDNPSKAMITFSYTEQLGGEKKPAKTKTELQREENARMALELARFRAGLRYAPGTPEAKRQEAEEEALRRAAFSGVGRLPGFGKIKTTPGLMQEPSAAPLQFPTPSYGFKPKPFSLLDQELKLKPRSESSEAQEQEKKKKEEGAPIQRKATPDSTSGTAPSLVNDVLATPGQPLDAATRGMMEACFGHDFSRVRIHTDERAAQSASSVDSLAYTSGEAIVFSGGAYNPHSHEGKHLLAHELAHVVQQTHPPASGSVIRRKGKPKAGASTAKFYQYVIDELANVARSKAKSRWPALEEPSNYAGLKALLELCEAVEQGNIAEIPKQLDAYMASDTFFHLGTLRQELMIELATRMFKLGLEAQSQKLRTFYAEKDRFAQGYDPEASRRNFRFYTSLVSSALASADGSSPEKAAASLDFMTRAFVPLRDALAAVNQKDVAFERRYPPPFILKPWMGIVEINDTLIEQIEALFGGIEAMFQALIDASAADFERGRGAETLTFTKRVLETKLRPVLFSEDKSKDIAGLRIQITHTTIKKGKGKISDEFAKGAAKEKRSVDVSTYDPRFESADELRMPLERLYEVRQRQIEMLARLYGATQLLPASKNKQGGLSEDAERNAEAIKKLKGGHLRLHSDDDWRAFVLQKYRDMVQPTGGRAGQSPAAALKSIIELLFAYFRAFTIHARYTNVYDIGDSYLNKDFPRALSGQLIHDCGVYALRVAYILSLVRAELKLRFRFVVLPAHIALVIDGDQVPTYVVNNDHYEEISASEWADMRRDWESYKETREVPDPKDPNATISREVRPPSPRDETQFVGELAGSTYISGPLDMPFIVSEVPKAGGAAKAAQAKLWDYYQRTSTRELFGSASKNKSKESTYVFHTRYLALTEQLREMHNDALIRAWNVDAPAAWASFDKLLRGDGKRSTISTSELLGLVLSHADNYEQAVAPVVARLGAIQSQQTAISEQMRNDPKLRLRGVRLGYGPRAAMLWNYYWATYRGRLQAYINELTGQAEQQIPLKTVRDRLAPPFIPVEEKKIPPLD